MITANPAEAPAPSTAHGVGVPLTGWQKFRMIVKVIELRLRFIALMAATALVFAYWDTLWNYYEKWNRPAAPSVAAAPDIEFFCPMHPSIVRPEPSQCPICGMPLSKRKRGEPEQLPEGVTARVQVAPHRIRQAGIRTVTASYEPLAETLKTVGTVAFDERRLARISSRVKGMSRVETLHVNFTGTSVEAGQPLAELYSPELYQAVRELLVARSAQRVRPQSSLGQSVLGNGSDLVELAREKLGLWGLTAAQIDGILASGKADYRLPILAPLSGIVVRKNVIEGQYVAEGDMLFEVADLDRVWVKAQVYEADLGRVQVGQAVTARVEPFPAETFQGTIAFIDPVVDPATRTVAVRYDLANPGHRLRPGMFATVTLTTPVADTPAFRIRLAQQEGDSKRLSQASLTIDQQQKCLVTGARLGSMGKPIGVEVEGHNLWICCASCESKLKATPDRYLAKLETAPQGTVLSVPESAVIDTGTLQIVYVETDPGTFEGRTVVLGPLAGGRYPVLEGLDAGDRVADAGAFLIDAETRLNPAAGAAYFGGSGTRRESTPAPQPADSSHAH